VYLLAFDSARGAAFDARVFEASTAQGEAPRVETASRAVIDTVDVASLVLLGGGIVAVALARRRLDVAVAAGALLVGANVTTQVLKPALYRLDPFGTAHERTLHGSFPSGHSTVATSIALALVLAAPVALKLPAALLGSAYAWAMGISLMVQGGHYPSDVAGGYLVAGAWAGLVAALAPPRPTGTRPESVRTGLALAGGLVLAFAAAVAVAVAARPEAVAFRVHVQTRLVFAAVVLAVLAAAVAVGLAALRQPRATA
jgi:membrane-associated phospholipid phosphatase